MASESPERRRVLFVTGRLAEFAMRQTLESLQQNPGFRVEPHVAVLPISVAALMTPVWVARHLKDAKGFDQVILPGHCRGDLAPVVAAVETDVVVGPEDLRDLPRYFGSNAARESGYGAYDIEILAEINFAPRLSRDELIKQAERFIAEGADRIDIGCEPSMRWNGVGDAVKALVDRGMKVSIDTFDASEVAEAAAAGADLVLSVNATNRERAVDWGVEVVVVPDDPSTLTGFDETIEFLSQHNVRYRLDPILEPIGFGFAASMGRYLETRRRYPQAEIMMGVGNLTELTDADSSGVNTLLIGFCQEVGIHSVLTTAVINWARSSVMEIDLARRLAFHSVTRKTLPKHLEPRLVTLRDPRPHRYGAEALDALSKTIKDPNWRIFAEDGLIHAMNSGQYLKSNDPFELLAAMKIDTIAHAGYLGYELMKAKTALTLNKDYRQDQALNWGFLTEPEVSHRGVKKATRANESTTNEDDRDS